MLCVVFGCWVVYFVWYVVGIWWVNLWVDDVLFGVVVGYGCCVWVLYCFWYVDFVDCVG